MRTACLDIQYLAKMHCPLEPTISQVGCFRLSVWSKNQSLSRDFEDGKITNERDVCVLRIWKGDISRLGAGAAVRR